MNLKDRQLYLSAWVQKLQDQNFSYGQPADRQRAVTAVRLAMGSIIPDDETRRKVLGLLFINEVDRPYSTSLLTDAQLHALRHWLHNLPAPNGEWTVDQEAAGELRQFADIIKPGYQGVIDVKEAEPGPLVQAAVALGGEIKGTKQPEKKHEPKKVTYFQFE